MESNYNSEDIVSRPKKNLLAMLKSIGGRLLSLFKEYPVTIAGLLILGLVLAIMVDSEKEVEKYVEGLSIILACFIGQSFFLEECFRASLGAGTDNEWAGDVQQGVTRNILRYALMVPALILAIAFKVIFKDAPETFLGADIDKVTYYASKFYICYFVIIACICIYHICKRHGENFEKYLLKTVFAMARTTIVYGMLACGILIIMMIFNELIYDTDSLVWRLQIFLIVGIYVPALLLALTERKDNVSKFARGCVLYVLEPMLLVAYLIIYVYIIKIFATNSVPNNSVFTIMTVLFALGMPIWSMTQGLEEESILGKISRYLPFSYLPFIGLQCWSMAIRISNHGVTTQRYFAIVLIIAELCYCGLYIYGFICKKNLILSMFGVLAVLCLFAVMVPGINYTDVTIRSQIKRLSKYTINEDLIDSSSEYAVRTIYRAITDVPYKGMKELGKHYSEDELEILKNCQGKYSSRDTDSLSAYRRLKELDVSGYNTVYYVTSKIVYSDIDISELNKLELRDNDGVTVYSANMTDWTNKLIDKYGNHKDSYLDLESDGKLTFNDGTEFYITDVDINYYTDTKKLTYYRVEGYLLTK